jgi:hypothetical protein
MLHVMLPIQYLHKTGSRRAQPHKRLMAAVLQTVVDDCRGSLYRQARGFKRRRGDSSVDSAAAYMASTDRHWPFSFENLCDALGLDAACLREELRQDRTT